MQELDEAILKLDEEETKLFNFVKFICNKFTAILRIFPENVDGSELIIEGYKVDFADYIEIFTQDGSSIHIDDYNGDFRLCCVGEYEEEFNMIRYEKFIIFSKALTASTVEAFKFIVEHDPKIFIPLFAVAKNIDVLVQICINKIDTDIQKQMHYINKKKKHRNILERLSEYLKSDEYLQKINE